MSRVVFVTDIHGHNAAYEELFSRADGVDAIVFGGDVTPLPPRDGGNPIEVQRHWIEAWMTPAFRTFHSQHPACAIYTMFGNDDWLWNIDLFERLESEGVCRLMHRKVQPFLDGFSIAGYSCVPVTPFYMKDLDRFDGGDWTPEVFPRRCWVSDQGRVRVASIEEIRNRGTIEADLEGLAKGIDASKTVFVVHTPPFETKLDEMYGHRHIGSPALRRFLEKHQPPLALHGHVHESPEMTGFISDTIGRTFCVNPGASLQQLHAVEFELRDPAGTLKKL